MSNVYLWRVDDHIIYHTDLDAAAELDGLSEPPDMTVTVNQFYAANCLARVINNEIALGKTAQELSDEAALARIAEIDAQFKFIEEKMIRPMLAHTLGTETTDDADRLNELSSAINTLRVERQSLELSLSK